jgi:hypothetical protein
MREKAKDMFRKVLDNTRQVKVCALALRRHGKQQSADNVQINYNLGTQLLSGSCCMV